MKVGHPDMTRDAILNKTGLKLLIITTYQIQKYQ